MSLFGKRRSNKEVRPPGRGAAPAQAAAETTGASPLDVAMIRAAEEGRLVAVRDCLERGANVNALDHEYDDDTALILAAWENHPKIVQLLVDHDADLEIVNVNRFNALGAAALRNHHRCVEVLVAAGAEIDLQLTPRFRIIDCARPGTRSEALLLGEIQPNAVHKPVDKWTVNDVGSFLERIELEQHRARFEKESVDGELLLTLSDQDLADAGVESKFHRRKIFLKLEQARKISSTPQRARMQPGPQGFHAFISYRRKGGAATARMLKSSLKERGINAFLDYDGLEQGDFTVKLQEQLEGAPCFVLVLTPGALERCRDKDDWVRKEIEIALRTGRVIIPVFDPDFKFPDDGDIPESIAEVTRANGVELSHAFLDATLNKLQRFMEAGTTEHC